MKPRVKRKPRGQGGPDPWVADLTPAVLEGFRSNDLASQATVKRFVVRKLKSYAARRSVSTDIVWQGLTTILPEALVHLYARPDMGPAAFGRFIDNRAQALVRAEVRQLGIGRMVNGSSIRQQHVPLDDEPIPDPTSITDLSLERREQLQLIKNVFVASLNRLKTESDEYHAFCCHHYLGIELPKDVAVPTSGQLRRSREMFTNILIDESLCQAGKESGERSKQLSAIAQFFASGGRGRTDVPEALEDLPFILNHNDGLSVPPSLSAGGDH